jgi:uroporphyrin-III C-methyltransferase
MGTASGDLDLLNDQAVQVLRSAEVVLHDDLVSPRVLELVPASAQVRNVHKLSTQAHMRQEKIHSLLIAAAMQGHQVVRVKAIGPVSSSRADEEIEALAQAGVDYEVIPSPASAVVSAANR